MNQMPDTTFTALAAHQLCIAREDARESLEAVAKQDVIDSVMQDFRCNCGAYGTDKFDFAVVISERDDFADKLRGLVIGTVSPDEFKAYAINALDAYGDRYATDRADYLEAS